MSHVASSVLATSQVHSDGSRSWQEAALDCIRPNPSRPRCHLAGGAQPPDQPQRKARVRRRDRALPAVEITFAPSTRSESGHDLQLPRDLGLLTKACQPELVEQVLARNGIAQRRGLLPPQRTIELVLGLCLFSSDPYQEVMKLLPSVGSTGPQPTPNKSSLCRARMRLGPQALADLFAATARPLATPDTRGAFWRDQRVMAIDGFTMAVPDSELNDKAFWGQVNKRGVRVGFPQVRLVGLVECGTHALVAAALGSYRDSEHGLAASLIPAVKPGMILLADRNFPGVVLWRGFTDAGAHLLWRVKSNVATKILEVLPDGTYLAQLATSNKAGRWLPGERPKPVTVRVIEYRVNGSREVYRLITTMLDPQTAPAQELAQMYAERWEAEGTIDELKTHQRGPQVVLRSRTPDGVSQEIWAHFLLHWSARAIMHEAACTTEDRDPDRISFALALRIIRRSLRARPSSPASAHNSLLAAIAELTEPRALVHRRHRAYERKARCLGSRHPYLHRRPPGENHRVPPPSITLVPATANY